MIVYASVLIALMIARPSGLLGERELFSRNALRRRDAPTPPTPDEVSA
jgi:branched-chain amino acid transport system permease protein